MPEATAVAAVHEASAVAVSEISWDSVQCHDTPTRSKMQEQEADTPIRTASTEKAEEKRITEQGAYLKKPAPQQPSYPDTSVTALYAP